MHSVLFGSRLLIAQVFKKGLTCRYSSEDLCCRDVLALYRRRVGIHLHCRLLDGKGGLTMSNQHSAAEEQGQRHRHEGPRKHIVAFIFSILLTVIAFAMVAAGEVNTSFIYIIPGYYGDFTSVYSNVVLDAYEGSRTCFPDCWYYDGCVRCIHDRYHGRILGLVVNEL